MYIDTHAHIYLSQFEKDIDSVISRAKDAKVEKILLPNIDLDTIPELLNCCSNYPSICYPMLGLHPCSVNNDWKSALKKMQQHPKVQQLIAVGEIGIDLYWDQSFEKEQVEAFEFQIQWALDLDLPIVIHSRSAIDLTIKSVAKFQNGSLKGVFHCFDQDLEKAKKILDLNFYVGIGGILTYKRNNDIRSTYAQIPLESVLIETDAPYLPPIPFRGKRNESSYVPLVAQQLATVYNIPLKEVAKVTTQNAYDLFDL